MEVKDTWLALQKAGIVVLAVSIIGLILGSMIGDSNLVIWGFVILANLIAGKFTLNVWNSYSEGIVADIDNNSFSFPASDVENSIEDIVKLKPLFDLAKRNSYPITEINALNNETKRWTTTSKEGTKKHVEWLLNISGDFGSQQLEFASKQKRDECRAMLSAAKKKMGSSFTSSDMNLDLQE